MTLAMAMALVALTPEGQGVTQTKEWSYGRLEGLCVRSETIDNSSSSLGKTMPPAHLIWREYPELIILSFYSSTSRKTYNFVKIGQSTQTDRFPEEK